MHPLLTWLWTLVPANPVVVRTVQGASRRLPHLWIRMLYLGALIALVGLGLLVRGGLKPSISLSELAKAGTMMFGFVSYAQVALICLLAPLFMAGAIAQEQAGKTYEILLTTPLTNLQVVLGALCGRLFFVLALLASGLPLFAVLLIFGGVPVSSVFVSFATAALVALLVGSVAVTLAVLQTGGRKAVFVFVVAIAAYLVAAYVVDVNLLRSRAPGITTWLTPLHPLLVLESRLNTANYKPPDAETLAAHGPLLRLYLGRPFTAFALLTSIASLVLVAWSTLYARRIVQLSGSATWLRRWLRLDAGGERAHPPRPVRGNPIAWREAHTRGNRTGSIVARWGFAITALLAAIVALGLYHGGVIDKNTFRVTLMALLLVETAVIVTVAIYMSAGSVSGEREDGTLDLILTTPITPRRYIWGKLRGLVRFLVLLLAAPLLTSVVVATYSLVGQWLGWSTATVTDTVVGTKVTHALMLPEVPILLAAMLVPFVAVCVMVGMNWSLKSRGVLGAVVYTVSIIAVFCLVMGMCGFQMVQNVAFVGPILSSFSPATHMLVLIDPWLYIRGFARDAAPGRVTLFLAALLSAAGYGAIVHGMLLSMVRGFDLTIRRLSGTG